MKTLIGFVWFFVICSAVWAQTPFLNAYSSSDGKYEVQIIGDGKDAFLYSITDPPQFKSKFLISNVINVGFVNVANGEQAVQLTLADGSVTAMNISSLALSPPLSKDDQKRDEKKSPSELFSEWGYNSQNSVGSESYDDQYRFITLSQEGTSLNGQDVAGNIKVVQKISSSCYLVSYEFQDNQSLYYLTNSKKLDAVDGQNVFILATVSGTKSYVSVLGEDKTVIKLKLKRFTLDGKMAIKAN